MRFGFTSECERKPGFDEAGALRCALVIATRDLRAFRPYRPAVEHPVGAMAVTEDLPASPVVKGAFLQSMEARVG